MKKDKIFIGIIEKLRKKIANRKKREKMIGRDEKEWENNNEDEQERTEKSNIKKVTLEMMREKEGERKERKNYNGHERKRRMKGDREKQ